MTLEEHVLAYLDGSLDESSSAELLHTLSASPEKRAVLEEHLRLNDMLALGRKPFAIPASAERGLAARLPALGRMTQGAPAWQPSGVIATGFQAVRSWFADRAILAASTAGMLAVAGGIWWMSGDGRISDPAQTTMARADTPASMSVASAAPSANNVASNIAESSSPNRPVSALPHRSIINYAARVTNVNEGATNVHPSSIIHHPSSLSAVSESSDSAPTIGEARLADAAIPFPGTRLPRTLHEIAFGLPREGEHPYTIGVNTAMNQNYLPQIAGATTAPLINLDPQLTFDYDLSEFLALGIEAGFADYGKLGTHFVLDPSLAQGPGYSRLLYSSEIQGQQVGYARAAMHVTLAPASEYPIRLGLSGGVAFENTWEPCAALSAGVARTLAEDFTLDLALVASGIYGMSSADAVSSPATSGVTGIVHAETSATRTFTSAFGVRAGFRFRP